MALISPWSLCDTSRVAATMCPSTRMPLACSSFSRRCVWLRRDTEYAPHGPSDVPNARMHRLTGITLMRRCREAMKYTAMAASHTDRTCLLYTSDAADERSSVDLG